MKIKPNVFIVCTGVGHINRGYESFTLECFNALKESPDFELFLLKGGGKSIQKEIKITCIKRNTKTAAFFSKVFGKNKYWVEQFTFLLGMLPYLFRYKPVVICYSDFILGTFLWHLRNFFKFKYKLLFSNGAPNGPPFKTEDHVQQLLPLYMDAAIKEGASANMQTLLPYGFDINIKERLNNLSKKHEILQKLGFSGKQKIVLSVGAVNRHHKRMDYIINEMSKLPENYFLVILGQFEAETPDLLSLAEQKLPGRHIITSVSLQEVEKYYISTDYFVLASLIEGFGRVLIEAQSYGLPCIVHESENAKQVLKEYGTYLNMEEDGALASCLMKEQIVQEKELLIKAAYNNYSWDALKGEYSDMISKLF
ncbi:MAG: glycosyltransferase [Mucilaginibacter sp.]|uniref:glycosyltransferase n=1 Tax=Mucilaginibacter sp. TaxID=1882438 RepID=UPI003265877C